MEINPAQPESAKLDALSALIIVGVYLFGLIQMLPMLVMIFIMGSIAFVGIRLVWQLSHLFMG